jgi:hypothetical protein
MGINQLAIKVLKHPPTYRIEKKEGVNLHSTLIHYQNKLIHEHDFITVRIKEANSSFVVRYTTCGEYYCGLCGKALHKKSRCICHI